MSFLTAQWKNLALVNYEIDEAVLQKYLPGGTVLDLWNGKCYVSLVGFLFHNTRLLGLKIPFHVNFEEINLRFYVKRFENGSWKRGVVFIKEIVPKPALTLVANTVYGENYQTLPTRHFIGQKADLIAFTYQWKANNKWNTVLVETEKSLSVIEKNSEAEFITEHYFGYTKTGKKTTYEYEVKHPKWEQHKVLDYNIDVDFDTVYGKEFGFLNTVKPLSVILAKGSEISVENKRKIKV